MPKERILPGKISYEKLFDIMKKNGVKKTDLRKLEPNPIHPTTIQKINAGNTINTDTIVILCDALNCQPGDIMEYIPNGTTGKAAKKAPKIVSLEEFDKIFGD